MHYPILKDKWSYPSVSDPEVFLEYLKSIGQGPAERFPSRAVVSYQSSVAKWVDGEYGLQSSGLSGFDWVGGDEGGVGLFSGFGIGGAATVTALDPAISTGLTHVVTIGTAGAIDKNLSVGDIVVCNRAIRDEGVSHHYLEPEKYAFCSPSLSASLQRYLDETGVPYRTGTTWTTDAVFRETAEEIRDYQSEGVLTVEMEAASVFALGTRREVEVACLFVVSDLISDLVWKPRFHHKIVQQQLKTLFQVSRTVLMQV